MDATTPTQLSRVRIPRVSASPGPPGPTPGTERVDARCFVDLAQAVSLATRSCGLAPPGFQTLPRRGDHGRVLRRTRAGAVVAIRTLGKSPTEVRNDMIDGVIRLQGALDGADEADLRARIAAGLREKPGPTQGRVPNPSNVAA